MRQSETENTKAFRILNTLVFLAEDLTKNLTAVLKSQTSVLITFKQNEVLMKTMKRNHLKWIFA